MKEYEEENDCHNVSQTAKLLTVFLLLAIFIQGGNRTVKEWFYSVPRRQVNTGITNFSNNFCAIE